MAVTPGHDDGRPAPRRRAGRFRESRFYQGMDWNAIASAYELVTSGAATRIDGDGWKIYRAGAIVRIDIGA